MLRLVTVTACGGTTVPSFFHFFLLFSRSTMTTPPKVVLNNEEWRARLTSEQFRVLREKGTEPPGTNTFEKHKPEDGGVFHCAGCRAPLFTSRTKFKSGCGWPAFYDSIAGAVERHPDADGRRTEIVCSYCGGHLGHVFRGEGFATPTDERHCVNSVSLTFQAADE